MTQLSPREQQTIVAALCRRRLFAFVWKVFEELHRGGATSFIPNWHVEAICHELEALHMGSNRRLVVTVPPRHLKSITVAVALPAFLLGHDPNCKVIVASYGQDLARNHAADFRRVIESRWYRAMFPDTRISQRGARQDEIRTTRGGGRKAVSLGGAVTGFGADYLIVDDLLKAMEASSEAERERAMAYLEGSLLTRLNDPRTGRVIAIQQRLHEEDPAGFLIGKGYRHLNLPAIAEEDEDIALGQGRMHHRKKGEPLFPQKMNLADLETMRRELGTAIFNMQYQQNPLAPDGSPLRWEWFGTYEQAQPRAHYQFVIQSWDTGMSSDPRSDYSVCTTWGFREGIWALLTVFRDRLDYPALKRKTLALAEEWQADSVLIEKAGTGIPLLQECHQRVPRCFRGVHPHQDKEVRFRAACAAVEAGNVLLPREAPWLADFRRELQGFPQSRYDDQVDSFSQMLNWSVSVGFQRKLPRHSPYRLRRRETEPHRG